MLAFCSTLLLSGCSLFSRAQGGLKVTTSQPANVFLESKQIGATPLEKKPLDAKRYSLKLVPQDPALAAYESGVKISGGFETTVDWQFGASSDESSGWVFEIEAAHKSNTPEIEIVTSPDNVPVTLNGENKGFSPLMIDSLTEGEYKLALQAPGYSPLSTNIRLIAGKRLLITAKLGRKPLDIATQSAQLATPLPELPTSTSTPKPTSKPTPKPTAKAVATASANLKPITLAKPYVEILDTPTGFLRVRDNPSISGAEIGRLNVGEAAPFLNEKRDEWFKIKFGSTASASGWVSSQYSRLVQ